MHFADLRRLGGKDPVFVATIRDSQEDDHYQITISGNPMLIKKTLANCDFQVKIEPRANEKQALKLSQQWVKSHTPSGAGITAGETIASLRKREASVASAKNSIVISIHRTHGQGTWWGLYFPRLFVPNGTNLYFVLPPVLRCMGFLFPATGDPDLLLTLNGAPGVVAASLNSGTAIDSISFGTTWPPFVPWFVVSGYLPGTTDFVMAGSVP